MATKERAIDFFNLLGMAKGVAILLVVIGHSGCPQYLFRFIYLFHMAFFFIASGSFFKEEYLMHPFTFVYKKIRSIYIPFVTIVTLYIIASSGLCEIGLISSSEKIADYPFAFRACFLHLMGGGNLFSPLWFLRSLLFSLLGFYSITFFCHKCVPSKYQAYIWWTLIIFFASIHWFSKLGLIPCRVFFRDLVAISLVGIGYTCQHHSKFLYNFLKQRLGKIVGWFSLVLLLLLATAGKSIGFVGARLGNPLFFYVSSLSGFYLLCWISMHFAAFSFLRIVLEYCGRHTMPIFVWHFVAFKLVSYMKIEYYHLPFSRLSEHPVIEDGHTFWWPIYTISGVLLPLLYDYIVSSKEASHHETSCH